MKIGFIVIGLLLTSACTAVNDRRTEARQYRQIDWESRYVNYASRCNQAGGRMIVRANHRMARSGIPRPGDYFNCTQNVGAAPRE